MRQFERLVGKSLTSIEGRLLVAVSGGADSSALLHSLSRLRRDCLVAHCNFHLRGDESCRDEAFVCKLCETLGLPLLIKHFDVDSYCREYHVSVEMACRDLRYDWFRSLLKEYSCSRIAVAHNADDNVETMLLNLFRGTGIEGLCGMCIDNGEVVRPLLQFSRRQIEEYLEDIGATYVVDSTNLSDDYRRNYIRNTLIPGLETRWKGVRSALHRTQENLQGASRFYFTQVKQLLDSLADPSVLDSEVLRKSPDYVTLVHEWLKQNAVSADVAGEMATVWQTMNGVGRHWLCGDVEVVLERDGFHLIKDDCDEERVPLLVDEELCVTDEVMRLMKSDRSNKVVYLPLSAEHYILRHPRLGDRISPLGMKGSSLVSDILKDAKLTTLQRRRYWLLEDPERGEIIWLPGLKRSRHSLISADRGVAHRISMKLQ